MQVRGCMKIQDLVKNYLSQHGIELRFWHGPVSDLKSGPVWNFSGAPFSISAWYCLSIALGGAFKHFLMLEPSKI